MQWNWHLNHSINCLYSKHSSLRLRKNISYFFNLFVYPLKTGKQAVNKYITCNKLLKRSQSMNIFIDGGSKISAFQPIYNEIIVLVNALAFCLQ